MLRRELIGFGSIINILLTGYFISFFINHFGPLDMPTFLVGPSTFIAALCLGPFIGFWTTKVTIPTLEKFGYTVPAFGGEE
ncbi:MAG: hypothetical protein LBT06_10655 [Hungatella sp.]|jgi:hypothetical protein|nr:hypothetical protein [Hungatella sp.]